MDCSVDSGSPVRECAVGIPRNDEAMLFPIAATNEM